MPTWNDWISYKFGCKLSLYVFVQRSTIYITYHNNTMGRVQCHFKGKEKHCVLGSSN